MPETSEAEDILEGVFCQDCGQYIEGDPPGHARSCADCGGPKEWL